MSKSQLRIILKHKTNKADEWTTVQMKPEEYFIARLEPEGDYQFDSVPKLNHINEYFPDLTGEMVFTELNLEDANKRSTVLIRETLWNDNVNRIIERIDRSNGKITLWECIHITKISTDPDRVQIVRYDKQKDVNVVSSHMISTIEKGEDEKVEWFTPPSETGQLIRKLLPITIPSDIIG